MQEGVYKIVVLLNVSLNFSYTFSDVQWKIVLHV